jgi:hypothetical protein
MLKTRSAAIPIGFSLPALALVCFCTCSCGRLLPSEQSQVTRLIEDNWNGIGHYDIFPTGQVQIVRENWNLSKGQTSPDDVHGYEVLSQQKRINITSNIDLTSNRNFSWDNFYSLTQGGVIRRLTVTLTSPGDKALRCPDSLRKAYGTDNIICVDMGVGSIQEIVRSQKFQIGTAQAWLLMGNYRWKWSDTERKIRDAQGKVTDENMKFMVIAQYEDFTKKWQLALIDYAPRTGQFAKQEQFDNVLRQAAITTPK